MKQEQITESYMTPIQIAEAGIMSLAKQFTERRQGRLRCYRIGKKILYSHSQIKDYLELCESKNDTRKTEENHYAR
jgi:hypothetical protein